MNLLNFINIFFSKNISQSLKDKDFIKLSKNLRSYRLLFLILYFPCVVCVFLIPLNSDLFNLLNEIEVISNLNYYVLFFYMIILAFHGIIGPVIYIEFLIGNGKILAISYIAGFFVASLFSAILINMGFVINNILVCIPGIILLIGKIGTYGFQKRYRTI